MRRVRVGERAAQIARPLHWIADCLGEDDVLLRPPLHDFACSALSDSSPYQQKSKEASDAARPEAKVAFRARTPILVGSRPCENVNEIGQLDRLAARSPWQTDLQRSEFEERRPGVCQFFGAVR